MPSFLLYLLTVLLMQCYNGHRVKNNRMHYAFSAILIAASGSGDGNVVSNLHIAWRFNIPSVYLWLKNQLKVTFSKYLGAIQH